LEQEAAQVHHFDRATAAVWVVFASEPVSCSLVDMVHGHSNLGSEVVLVEEACWRKALVYRSHARRLGKLLGAAEVLGGSAMIRGPWGRHGRRPGKPQRVSIESSPGYS